MLQRARALALASGDRSITLMCRGETEPGLPRCWRALPDSLPAPGVHRPLSRHAGNILVAGCRPRGDFSSDGKFLKQRPRLSQGCEATVAQAATLTG